MNKSPPQIRMPPTRSASASKIGDPDAADRFIRGEAAEAASAAMPVMPPVVGGSPASLIGKSAPAVANLHAEWELLNDEPRSRGKAKGTLFNMRLTAREEAMISFITKRTPYSKHALIIAALRPALARAVEDLTGEDVSDLLRDPDTE